VPPGSDKIYSGRGSAFGARIARRRNGEIIRKLPGRAAVCLVATNPAIT